MELTPIVVPKVKEEVKEEEAPKVHIRFKISAEHIVPSITETLEEIDSERMEAWNELNLAEENYYSEYLARYQPRDAQTLPVPFVPVDNVGLKWKYEIAKKKYDSLTREYFYYLRYLEFITSEERPLEIEAATTTFFMSKEQLEEITSVEDETMVEDVFAQADKRQMQLLKQQLLEEYRNDPSVVDPEALAEYVAQSDPSVDFEDLDVID